MYKKIKEIEKLLKYLKIQEKVYNKNTIRKTNINIELEFENYIEDKSDAHFIKSSRIIRNLIKVCEELEESLIIDIDTKTLKN